MRTLILVAAVAALSACETMESGPDPAARIATVGEQFEAAYASGDGAAVAALYTPDAVVLPPGMARIDGRAGIAEMWQGFIDAGVRDLDLETVELEVHGQTASELGTFTLTAPDGEGGRVEAGGKYVVLWRRGEDGVWRLDWDIWNENPAG